MKLCICGETGTKRCRRCKSRWYCSKKCQKLDWDSHKHNCINNNSLSTNSDRQTNLVYSFSDEDIKTVFLQVTNSWKGVTDIYNSIPSHAKGSIEKKITKDMMNAAVDDISNSLDRIQGDIDFTYELSKSLENNLSMVCWQEELVSSSSLEMYIRFLNTYESMQLERTSYLLNRVIDSVIS